MVELGWENFVDNLKNCWENCENCEDDWKSWVDDWKNYWNDRSGLHGLTVSGHCCFGSTRNSGDFSSQDCMFMHMDYCSALKGHIHRFRKLLLSLKHRHSSNT